MATWRHTRETGDVEANERNGARQFALLGCFGGCNALSAAIANPNMHAAGIARFLHTHCAMNHEQV